MNYSVLKLISMPGGTAGPGDVLTSEQLAGVDIERLINLGALSIAEADATAETDLENIDLEDMTNKQLTALAAGMGLEVKPRATKAELLEAITDETVKQIAIELGIAVDGMSTEELLAAIAEAEPADDADADADLA